MIDTWVGFPREQLGKEMLVGNPRLGWYLVQLFSTVFTDISHEKREELYSLLDSEKGRYSFSCVIGLFERVCRDKKNGESDPWNKNYSQEKLLEAKLGFLDMLWESFGSYERSKISNAIDGLFPWEKSASTIQETISTQKGIMSKIKGLVWATA